MPPKSNKTLSSIGGSDDTYGFQRISLQLVLQGDPPGPGEWMLLTVFNGYIVLDGKWRSGAILVSDALPINLYEPYFQELISDTPLIFLLRLVGGKGAKEIDPLLNVDNRAGATVDLFPLLLGATEIFITVPFVHISSGQNLDCSVEVQAIANEALEEEDTGVPLSITMISAHCLPYAKDGTVYIGAIGLDGVYDAIAVNFGVSLSSASAEKIVWATASNAGYAANTHLNVPTEDVFTPEGLTPNSNDNCRCFYWNAMKRVRIDPNRLRTRLSSSFVIELAGIPKSGKIDVRGRYMGFVDAGVLLEPGQYGVTIRTPLFFYNEAQLPEDVGALLELPPSSARVSARESEPIIDEYGHSTYAVIRFDLCDPLIPKVKMAVLFETIGLVPPEGPAGPIDDLDEELLPEDPTIDVRRIKKEGGALAVHKELSGLACRGAVPMNQGIKRTAANRLLMRIRNMLKQFLPEDCPYIDWQEIVKSQHAASRRAVTSSFAPQPPPIRPSPRFAAARCRMARDYKTSDKLIDSNVRFISGSPRSLLSKALRCLEERRDLDAKNYILKGLNVQPRNRYLLWLLGGTEFDKGREASEIAAAALRVAVKADYSDGPSNVIGWGALHSLHHWNGNVYPAFVAAKRMRKSYELPREWTKFLRRWTDNSGEEEVFWIPSTITPDNPLMMAAAFFLCLRCYKFSEAILRCVEKGCAFQGSGRLFAKNNSPDMYYLRAASFILRQQTNKALDIISQGVRMFGPSPFMSQIRATCLACAQEWNDECEKALTEAEVAGAEICPSLLIIAAHKGFLTNPNRALQRAARAHKVAPSPHTALIISRIYTKLKESSLAERWAAVAVKWEPLLADGWAVLALLAMYERNLDKARPLLRTAKQVGSISPDIEEEVKKVSDIVQIEALPESLVKDLCICKYY